MTLRVDRLRNPLPEGVLALLADDERAGTRSVRRLVDEWASGTNRFNRPGEVLFGGWVGEQLVGVCGLNVDPYAGEERIGRVRRMYVLIAHRRCGIGRRLVMEVIAAARGRFDSLRLRTVNPEAARLYEAIGFRRSVGAAHYTHAMTLEPSRPVLVVAYQPRWKDEFDQIAEHIHRVVGYAALRVDHIGSTAVPALGAKDVIDVQITVADWTMPEG
jgi:GNAT superfamily N-acetyltransferase